MSWRETTHKLAFEDVAQLKQQLTDLRNQLKPLVEDGIVQNRPDMLTQQDQVRRRIQKIEKVLEMDDALLPRTTVEKNKLFTEQKELEAELRKEAPSRRVQWTQPKEALDFERAVTHIQSWQNRNIQKIERWKEIRRLLDPQNPYADKTEALMRGFQPLPT